MKILCTICARGGSQGLPKKNIRMLANKPLIAHTIIQAQQSNLFQTISVSSDSPEILACAEKYGISDLIKRPDALATPDAPKIPVIQHAIQQIELKYQTNFDIVVDLDPTSPLRTIEDIKKCVELLIQKNATNVITGTRARKSPYFNMVELDQNRIAHLSKKLDHKINARQQSPVVYEMNASIYVWWRNCLLEKDTIWQHNTAFYEMPYERSVDIDSEIDFNLVELLYNKIK